MWIFFNMGILDLKIPVLTTYLRTMWKVTKAGHRLTQKELVEDNQKTRTLSKHLNAAVEVGLIAKKRQIYRINGQFRSTPNEYIPLDSTHKLWVENMSEIDDAFSYSLQKMFGKEHSKHYNDKFEKIAPTNIHIEHANTEDEADAIIALTIDASHLNVTPFKVYKNQQA